jgi:hypothetical protein
MPLSTIFHIGGGNPEKTIALPQITEINKKTHHYILIFNLDIVIPNVSNNSPL